MTPPPAPDVPPHDPAAARAAKRLAALDEMMDMSLRAARVVDAEIAAFAEAPRGEDSPRTVERLADALHATARCLRLTVALQDQLDQDAELRLRQRAEAVARAQAQRDNEILERRRVQTRVAVEQAIEAKDGDLAHSFAAQEKRRRAEVLIEREYADRETVLGRSTGAVIAQICRRVGLHPDFTRWNTAWAADALAVTPPPPPPPPRRPRVGDRNRSGGAQADPPPCVARVGDGIQPRDPGWVRGVGVGVSSGG